MRTRATRAVLIVALAGLGAAAPAHATLVFQTGGGVLSSGGRIWVAADDGSGARRLVSGDFPHISRDGQTVAYMANGLSNSPSLRVIPTAGGTPRTLVKHWQYTYDGVQYGTFDWSPDSRYVVVAAGPDEDGSETYKATERLVVADVTTGANRTVARRSVFDYASFSPDSSELVYAQRHSFRPFAKEDLHIASVADGTTRKLTHDGHSLYPVWGPEKIVFAVSKRPTARRRRRYTTKFNLATIAADGSGRRQLTHDKLPHAQTGLLPTEWSADGTRLLAQHQGGVFEEKSYPVTVDPVTGEERVVGNSRHLVGTALSRDGSTILGQYDPQAVSGSVGTADYATGDFSVLLTHAANPDWNR